MSELTCRSGVMLMNSPDERGHPHLWGHVQEAVLIDSANVLGRKDLAAAAVQSADAVFVEATRCGFDLPSVVAYDVQAASFVMDRLARMTGESKVFRARPPGARLVRRANPAGVSTYDRDMGRAHDGIDDGRVKHHSGAEANVSAGLARLHDPFVLQLARKWSSRRGHSRRDPTSDPRRSGGSRPYARGGAFYG
ncbi:MAG TPA: hypothetical protein VGU71_06465 [Candidatus Dormibacteraeota bacterium]|nr:hypothetical protein [Candidatus Dormibacteraeota bacterium]